MADRAQRVLVIDDNDDLRELMQVILDGGGYEVEVAHTGIEGLQALRRRPFDLVVTDIFMPSQDGLETIQQLRSDFPTLKVIAVSGGGKMGASDGYLLSAMQIGADGVLAKPFDPDALLRLAGDLLARG